MIGPYVLNCDFILQLSVIVEVLHCYLLNVYESFLHWIFAKCTRLCWHLNLLVRRETLYWNFLKTRVSLKSSKTSHSTLNVWSGPSREFWVPCAMKEKHAPCVDIAKIMTQITYKNTTSSIYIIGLVIIRYRN